MTVQDTEHKSLKLSKFQRCPAEIIEKIIKYLDVKDRIRLAYMCRYLNKIISCDDAYWREQISKEWNIHNAFIVQLSDFLADKVSC
jgi:hypothetical protein